MFASELDFAARRLTKQEAPRSGAWVIHDPCPTCQTDVPAVSTPKGPVCPYCRTSLRGIIQAKHAATMSLSGKFGGAR